MIANQTPTGVDANKLKISTLSAGKKTIDADKDIADLFNYNFSNQTVAGAYSGLAIPTTKKIDVTGYVAPVRGRLTSPYGWRASFGRMHKGVDLSLKVGDTVRAAFDGRIRITKYEGGGYGYYVVVRHDNGLETVYGHLSRFLVKPNQYVKAGQPIALGGNTGRSTGPHLHFETRFMGLALNPASIIDFDNYVTHQDVFTFNKSSYDRAQVSGPRVKASHAKKSATSKSKKKKSTASSKRKSRRK
ncbi:MAG: M23 family metallopeptidase [Bacteroides sp.]|nr:M23 family metallopeptidase [Bacteroides sp.]MCM1414157.1 M23 family metallopeptidase [Bacteroides sp.]MCM1471293.1 M23 family metallopeptidase [Bacteroides sp.]